MIFVVVVELDEFVGVSWKVGTSSGWGSWESNGVVLVALEMGFLMGLQVSF